MLQHKAPRGTAGAFRSARTAPRHAARCTASSSSEASTSRRDLLAAGGALLAAPLIFVPSAHAEAKRMQEVKYLGTFQRVAQRDAFVARVSEVLDRSIVAADASAAMRAVLHDAGTYDAATGTGGFNGSIHFDEELKRPENAGLKPLFDKLKAAKAEIDEAGAKVSQQPISWADLEVLAARTAVQAGWRELKVGRAATKSGGKLIANVYGADWKVQLGRIDATEPDPAGRLPARDADVAAIKAFMAQLGAKPGAAAGSGPFTAKPPFWEQPAFVVWTAAQDDTGAEEARLVAADPAFAGIKRKYDQSRETLTRTDFEVDFITFFDRLNHMGASFDPTAYLVPEALAVTRF